MLDWLKEKIEDFLTPKKGRRRTTKPVRKKKKAARLRPRKKGSKKKVLKRKSKLSVKKAVPKKKVTKKSQKKNVVKKLVKKVVKSRPKKKKIIKKKATKKKTHSLKTVSKGVKIGTVSHAFTKIQVLVFKVEAPFKVGDAVVAWHKDVKIGRDKVKSMQINHIPIDEARKGEEIGLKLKLSVKVGDDLYLP